MLVKSEFPVFFYVSCSASFTLHPGTDPSLKLKRTISPSENTPHMDKLLWLWLLGVHVWKWFKLKVSTLILQFWLTAAESQVFKDFRSHDLGISTDSVQVRHKSSFLLLHSDLSPSLQSMSPSRPLIRCMCFQQSASNVQFIMTCYLDRRWGWVEPCSTSSRKLRTFIVVVNNKHSVSDLNIKSL